MAAWGMGVLSRGEGSQFVPGREPKALCMYWPKNECRNGDNCLFAHEGPHDHHDLFFLMFFLLLLFLKNRFSQIAFLNLCLIVFRVFRFLCFIHLFSKLS